MWQAYMNEFRSIHLGAPAPGRSVFAELQAAYEAVAQPRKDQEQVAPGRGIPSEEPACACAEPGLDSIFRCRYKDI
jgi:hypothetical protein